MSTSFDFTKKALVVVTGASRGIGRQIAIDIAARLKNNSIIILVARSESDLLETKRLVLEKNGGITVQVNPIDLAAPDLKDYQKIFKDTTVENAIIFHNAGSVGCLDSTLTYNDLQQWRKYFDFNLFSVSMLNSVFVETMRKYSKKIYVVNTSSMCGTLPFKNMGMYGAGKAARNLFFKVLAVEEPELVVLNYSPGPVDTEMVSEVIANVKDAEMKSMFVGLKKENTILKAEQTVGKLLVILEGGEFKSGDLIDYYDRDITKLA